MRALLIAEKSSLMREIQTAYNHITHPDDIDFTSFVGHIMKMSMPDKLNPSWSRPWRMDVLPMIPEKWQYEVNVPDIYQKIEDKLNKGKYDYVINACDSGREGQLIFWAFYDYYCEKNHKKLPVKRLWSDDVTQEKLKASLMNLRDEGTDEKLIALTESARLRAKFDWLIGLNLTRAVSIKFQELTNIGRVKTPITNILYLRELEILNFVPKDFFTITGEFKGEAGTYKGFLVGDKKAKRKFDTEEECNAVKQSLGDKFTANISTKEKTIKAPNLYSLNALLSAANSAYKYGLKETAAIAQRLYDAAIISYPRTDTGFLTEAVAKEIKPSLAVMKNIPELEPYVSEILNQPDFESKIEAFSKNKDYVNDKEVTDHYGLIPTGKAFDFKALDTQEQNVLLLICKRLLSIFMLPIKKGMTEILTTDNNENNFLTKGETILEPGYSVLYKKLEDKTLPNIKNGESVDMLSALVESDKTTPPARYTPTTLNNLLEDVSSLVQDKSEKNLLKQAKGLGKPATRAEIIDTLQREGFFVVQNNVIFPQEKCMNLMKKITHLGISSPSLTADCEEYLQKIEKCDKSVTPQQSWEHIKQFVDEMLAEIKNLNIQIESLGECPACHTKVISTKFNYHCETPDCLSLSKNILKAEFTPNDIKEMLIGKAVRKDVFCKDNEWHVCDMSLNGNKLKFDYPNEVSALNKKSPTKKGSTTKKPSSSSKSGSKTASKSKKK